ncbi:hypothetical protein [Hansschlegelia plantiphila]|uniref:GCVT N-terminal domain-containing protein n=1 Tax=Hansschlegelia plantiphila TaxID=374655 RepID=A0A9W6J2W7_9HYPH|nr:hypothetical protein [Hansschlegelia plantiphila]GLK68309.1 hypothetical protein GCM10008179_19470 [Hansschlegelia plantiphila]
MAMAMGGHMRSDRQVVARAMEGFANHYAKGDPTEILKAGRPLRLSPTHSRCEAAGAVFEPVLGWEIPAWFAPGGETQDEAIAQERAAAIGAAAIFDLGSLAKFHLMGSGAREALEAMATAAIGGPGRAARTLFLGKRGGVQADVTVVSLGETDHIVLAPAARATLLGAHISREIAGRDAVISLDVSAGYGALGP